MGHDHVIRVVESLKRKEKGSHKILEEIMAENFLELIEHMNQNI